MLHVVLSSSEYLDLVLEYCSLKTITEMYPIRYNNTVHATFTWRFQVGLPSSESLDLVLEHYSLKTTTEMYQMQLNCNKPLSPYNEIRMLIKSWCVVPFFATLDDTSK